MSKTKGRKVIMTHLALLEVSLISLTLLLCSLLLSHLVAALPRDLYTPLN